MSAARHPSLPSQFIYGYLCIIALSRMVHPLHAEMAWQSDIATARKMAAETEKLVLLHFWADRCPPCQRLEAHVYSQPAFHHELQKMFVPVKINAGNSPDLLRLYQVNSWPTDIVLTPDGDCLYRGTSPQDGQLYLRNLGQIAWRYRSGLGAHDFAYGSSQTPGVVGAYAHPEASTAAHQLTGNYELSPWSPTSDWPSAERGAHSGIGPTSLSPSPGAPQVASSTPKGSHVVNGIVASGVPVAGVAPTADLPQGSAQGQPVMIRNQYVGPDSQRTASASTDSTPAYQLAAAPATGNSPQPMSHASPDLELLEAPSAGNGLATAHGPAGEELQRTALDGHCCISLVEENRWTPGDPRWGVHHRGRLYLFSSAAAQQRFLTAADRYSPALAGYDPVVFHEEGRLVPGQRAHGLWYEERMYLFASEEHLAKFELAPAVYATAAREALAAVDHAR